MLTIKIASPKAFYRVRDFYHHLIDEISGKPHRPKWVKGIYPSDDYLKESLVQKELFVGSLNGELCAAMIVNQKHHEEYNNIPWPTEASENEVAIIHALGILPAHEGKGRGSQMLKAVVTQAKMQKQKAIRLDVLTDNIPAIRLYEKLGFQHVATVPMYYPDTGWIPFRMYEYSLLPSGNKNYPL